MSMIRKVDQAYVGGLPAPEKKEGASEKAAPSSSYALETGYRGRLIGAGAVPGFGSLSLSLQAPYASEGIAMVRQAKCTTLETCSKERAGYVNTFGRLLD